MRAPPSGEQFEIRYGDQRATIVEVGGGVREYAVGDRPVLDPYPIDALCDGEHGTPLIPWPNRLADGVYRFDGTDYAVALNEPERHNAIHGFLSWRPGSAVEHDTSRVVMGTRLRPLAGYPFTLDIRVTYEFADDGLVVSTTAVNVGDQACPYGAGQHPYLSPGPARSTTASSSSAPRPGSSRPTNVNSQPARRRSKGPSSTSGPAGASATRNSTHPSPTWTVTKTDEHGRGSLPPMAPGLRSGSTGTTRSSRSTPAIP